MFVTKSMPKYLGNPGYFGRPGSFDSTVVFSPLEICHRLNSVCVEIERPDIIMQVDFGDVPWPDSILTAFSALLFPAIYQKRKIVNSHRQ